MSNHSVVVQNLESFKNQILQGITYSESTPTSGQFTWDTTQRCVHVVTDNRGSFRIPLPKVNIGDTIKIQFECLPDFTMSMIEGKIKKHIRENQTKYVFNS